ncbi:DUF748 domain-containing protein [Acidovorax lacteus]|uniref:DUF748 domain-containing protein n=1 Tax=Acidovorax lacteus TaxID=1924988 RepID=UPI0031E6418C
MSFVSRWDRLWPARWRTPRGLAARRWLLRTAASVLALWALLWLLAPLARAPLERVASGALGRTVHIGSLSLRPWSLTLVLQDVRVAHAQGQAETGTPQLAIDRVAVNAAARSLLLWAPVIDSLDIDHPALVLRHRGEGHYDVDDLLDRWLAPATPPSSGPARFALYNLALRGGSVRFADAAVQQTHTVEDLTVQLPFVSTLGAAREVRIAPRLAFTLDGSRFDTAAQAQPFAPQQRTEARIRWDGVDLAPYLAYWPATLPVRPQAARLDADLTLTFEDRTPPLLQLQGTLQVHGLDLRTRDGAPLLSHERLTLAFEDLRPLEAQARIGSLEWTAPVLHLHRNAQGQWVGLPAPGGPTAANPPAAATTARSAWQVAVRDARMAGGTVHWRDESVDPAASLLLRDVALHLRDADSQGRSRATLEASATLPQGRVQLQGQGQPQALELQASLQDVGLAQAQPYLAHWFDGRWSGRIGGTVGLQWRDAAATGSATPAPPAPGASAPTTAPSASNEPASVGWVLTAAPLVVQDLAFEHAGRTAVGLGRLDIEGLRADGAARTLSVERIALQAPQLQAERDAQGRWMAERWWRHSGTGANAVPPTAAAPDAQGAPGAASAASAPVSSAQTAATATSPAWQWRVARLEMAKGRFALRDAAAVRPVALQLTDLQLAAGALDSHNPTPAAVRLVTRVAYGDAAAGRLSYDGTLALVPHWALAGRVEARQWPLQALDGYLAQHLALQLERAEGGFAGDVAMALRPQGLDATVSGDLLIDKLRARTTQVFSTRTAEEVGDDLLAWNSLNLQGLRWQQTPGAVPQLSVRATTLSNFYARVAINEQGQLNLAQLRQAPRDGPPAPTDSAATPGAPLAASAASVPASGPVPGAAAPPPAVALSFGPVSLVQGHVRFSDDYIRPAYAAELTGLTGRLGAFDNTGTLPPAELELRGRAEGTASLEVTGQLMPLADPMVLDIRGRMRDLELPPLSPYSVKYAGHGIERGKLSLDVAYEVLPSGELRARNKLVLRQLTFGEPVAGAPASLPVRLAAALLADRNGVIDIELPVSGSLKDPEFSIGPVVARLLGSVLRKALTAPFSLLMGGASGGDTSSGVVVFAPGSAQPTDAAREQVRGMAEALAQRPQVQLTVTGVALAQAERDALQHARLERRLLQEKRRQNPQDDSPVQAAERSALLRALYLRSDVPKPRTLLGLPKELPDADMETLLRTQDRVDDAALRELASQRAQAVRQLLVERGLADERIFVAAPRAVDGASEGSPRAELSVATQ